MNQKAKMENSTILHNLTPERLQDLIRSTIREEIETLNPPKTQLKYLTRLEVCELLKISLPTLHGYIHQGKIIGHRIGRRVLFSEQDIINSVKEIPNLKYSRRR